MFVRAVSFRTLTIFIGSAICLAGTFAAGWTYSGILQDESDRLLRDSFRVRADIGVGQISRRMHAAWEAIDQISKTIDLAAGQSMRDQLDFLQRIDRRWQSLVVADAEGRVLYGSSAYKEQSNVSKQRWFRRGLQSPYIGENPETWHVNRADAARRASERSIEMSKSINGTDGQVTGVVSGLISWGWLTEQLDSIASPGIDVILVNRERQVLYGPADLVDQRLNIGSGIASSLLTAAVGVERWPDGKDYLASVVPSFEYHDLPDVGWSVILRTPTSIAFQQTRDIVFAFWTVLITATAAFIALLIVAAIWIDRPLQRLVRYATDLAEGRATRPPEIETRYQEAALLSAALVRLQSKLAPRLPEALPEVESPATEPRILNRTERADR